MNVFCLSEFKLVLNPNVFVFFLHGIDRLLDSPPLCSFQRTCTSYSSGPFRLRPIPSPSKTILRISPCTGWQSTTTQSSTVTHAEQNPECEILCKCASIYLLVGAAPCCTQPVCCEDRADTQQNYTSGVGRHSEGLI